MVETPSLALAFAAGFVSFVSPCCLPLVPGYLAAVSGGLPDERRRLDLRLLGRCLLFVGTFSAIFVALGLGATALGSFLFDNRPLLEHVAGVAIILMGLLFVASAFVLRLNRDWRPAGLVQRAGSGGPIVAGAAFAIAWTPCVGPTLGAVLGLASTQTGTGEGALLLAVYSAGLSVPFLLTAVVWGSAQGRFGWFRRHHLAIQVLAGTLLVGMGVLVLSGELFQLNIQAQKLLSHFNLNFFQSI